MHGIALFREKGYSEEQSLEIGKNNYAKGNLPVLTGYCCNNVTMYVLQTQKDTDTEPISYADMMMLWQVNRIRNPSIHEKELALDENSESDFVMVPYPVDE